MGKIKSGDMVTVIAGNDKGKTGQVLRVLRSEGKVVVEGINIRAKHVKGENGGIIRSEAPIDASNVKLGKATAKKAPAPTTPKATKDTVKKTKAPAKKPAAKKAAKSEAKTDKK